MAVGGAEEGGDVCWAFNQGSLRFNVKCRQDLPVGGANCSRPLIVSLRPPSPSRGCVHCYASGAKPSSCVIMYSRKSCQLPERERERVRARERASESESESESERERERE